MILFWTKCIIYTQYVRKIIQKELKASLKKKNCLSNEVYIWQNVFVKVLSAAQDLPDLLWIKLYNEKFILKFTDIS